MFHALFLDPIQFCSNPPLDAAPGVDWHTREDGSPVNTFNLMPRSNKSYFSGAHFDASRDSLRARLNLGIPLQRVNLGVTENDPNKLAATAARLSSQISQRAESRKSSVVESSND